MPTVAKKQKINHSTTECNINDPVQNSVSIKCYDNAHSQIFDELKWLNRLLTVQVIRMREANDYDRVKDFRGLFIVDEEIDAMLAADIFETHGDLKSAELNKKITELLIQAKGIKQTIDMRIRQSLDQNHVLPLVQLVRCFNLTEFEYQVLVICLAPLIDNRYEKFYAYLQNDMNKKNPSVDLILNLVCHSLEEKLAARDYLALQARLIKFRLLEFCDNGNDKRASLLSKQLKASERIAEYLLGSRFIDSELESVAELYYSQQELSGIILPEIVKDQLIKFIKTFKNQDIENRQNILFSFYGPYGVGRQDASGAISRELGLPLLIIDLEAILNLELPFKQTLELAFRESALLPTALYFKNVDAIFSSNENPYKKELFLRTVNENSWLSFISSNKALEVQGQLPKQRFIQVEFMVPDYTQRQQLWRLHLNGRYPMSEEVDLNALAGKFNFTLGQIRDAAATARNRALWRSPENGQINIHDLYEGCRAQSNQKLKTLAHKIKPKYKWKDIVLPSDQMAQLREITNHVKYKHVVYGDWGFDRKLSLGKGLNVLFSGPSGTGKTMTAEIMANELNLDLYKIDLSTVVSKYIGETEKNLNKIFKEAETSNAILFFDEADALFGKRSEVKDAHDRYANIEIGYLLQKMDEYTGVVILATNLRKNMDEAFVRRMRFTIDFPFPEEEYRLSIWQNIFPKETPLEKNIDYKFLARKFKVSGGNIKNIALAAAFYAADDGLIVTMEHVIQATKRELQKKGKLCVKADFEEYYELVQH